MTLLCILFYLFLGTSFFSHKTRTQPITIENSEICQRYGQSSASVGSRIYYDGGWISKTAVKETGDAIQQSSLLAVNLSASWDANKIEPFSMPIAPAQHLTESSVLFADRNGFLHQYGFHQDKKSTFNTWIFNTQVSGASWTNKTPAISGLEMRGGKLIFPIANAGYAQSNNFGYSVGGSSGGGISFSSSVMQYTLDANRPAVANISAGFMNMSKGALVWIPLGGGQLISIGGLDNNDNPISPGKVYIFDTISKKWFNQSCTGDFPESLIAGTAAGISSQDSSSYNIYVMNPLGMFILSLPSFTWYSVSSTGQYAPWPRERPSLNLAGNRQLILYGGQNGANCETQTIYVFDMTKLEWVQSFDNKAASYEVPSMIFSRIGGGGKGGSVLTPPSWDDPELEKLWYGESPPESGSTITRTVSAPTFSIADTTQTSQSTSGKYSPTTTASDFTITTIFITSTPISKTSTASDTSTTCSEIHGSGPPTIQPYTDTDPPPLLNLAGIIGVSVVGFIFMVFTLTTILLFYRRHHRYKEALGEKPRSKPHPIKRLFSRNKLNSALDKAELDGAQINIQIRYEMEGQPYYEQPVYEVQGSQTFSERYIHELQGNQEPHEMQGSSTYSI